MNVAIFCRVSDKSEETILKNQLDSARAYVKGKGWFVVREYVEIRSSKGITPVLKDLLEAAERKEFEAAVFHRLSRMTRGGGRWAFEIFDRLKHAHCGWFFVEQPLLDWGADTQPLVRDILLSVLSAVDEDYRRFVSVQTRKSMDSLKAKGVRLGRHKDGCTCGVHAR